MSRLFLALIAVFLCVLPAASQAGESRALFSQRFSYHPLLLGDIGPAMNPDVVRGPEIDRTQAYLLDISEEDFLGKHTPPVRTVWDRIRNGFVVDPLRGPLVTEREHWYRQRKDLVEAISYKSRRYLYHIVEAVEKRGLPMELALLPFVESGFEPHALSSAQAAGLWQFIPGTAQRFRLKLSDQYDARRDIVASTEAALDYLQFLHGIFKDWKLALAAYNWGEEAVARAVQRNQVRGLPTDYESLVMPEETRYYVPKLMAIRNIVQSPERHGITLADIDNRPYFSIVEVPVELDIQAVARLAGSTTAEVLALNPSHKSTLISGKGRPALLIPAERAEEFSERVAALPVKVRATRKRDDSKADRKAILGYKGPDGTAL